MKKKISRLLLIFILTFVTLFVGSSTDSDIKVNAASSEYEISISPKYIMSGYAFPLEPGVVYFTISISKEYNQDIDVYYETRDKSAIASLGDYTAKESFATIPKNKKTVDVAVYVGRSEFAVMDQMGMIYSREFEIVLTDVVGITNFTYGKQSAKAMIGYDYIYRTKIANRGTDKPILYFEDYEKVDVSVPMTTDEIDGEGEVSVNYDFSQTALYSHWKKNYLNTGLAQLYATFKGKIDDWGLFTYWSYAELQNANDKTIVGVKSEGYYDMHEMNPNNYNHVDYGWYDNVYVSYDTQTKYVKELCCSCKDKFTIDHTSNDIHCDFYLVGSDPNYTLRFRSEGGYDRKLVDTSIYSTLIDIQTAKIEENRFYASSLTKVGDKLRISIRFNEPVYVLNDVFNEYGLEKSTIKLAANNNARYITELTYAGGNYTDTLFYEVDYEDIVFPDGGESITSFKLYGGNGYINDFAYKTAREEGKEPHYENNSNPFDLYSTASLKIEADLRVPTIELAAENKNAILKQHSVTVSVGNINLEESKLYYSWEKTTDSLGDAIKQRTYYGIPTETNTIVGGGYSGKRYLHVYVETKYGKGKYAVYDTALGFDNTAPTVTVDSVDGVYQDRVFNLTVSDNFSDANSGLKAVYMYYKKALDFEYTTIEIKKYYSKVIDDTFQYEVKPSKLGIASSDYDYVNIGFYAVDNLGNKILIDYSEESEVYFFDNGSNLLCFYDSINEESGHILHTLTYDTLVIKKNPDEDLYLTFTNYDYIEEMAGHSPKLESLYDMNSKKNVPITFENPSSDPTKVVMLINPTDSSGEFLPGYYRMRFYIEVNGEKYYSQYFYLYLTEERETEVTPNYLALDNQYVLNNYVYQLSVQYPNYYFLDIAGTLHKEPYATATTAASFSSYDKAYQYVYTKELLDLYAKRITAAEANYLNSGTVGAYRKAEGEDTIAKEGQIWIRYKRVKWDYIDQESSWVWYCYSEYTSNPAYFEIDTTVGVLPDLLVEALTTVSTKITKNGGYTYLVGSENTDKHGAPKLNANQIHISLEFHYSSNCGTLFANDVYFSGDPNIIKSKVIYDNTEYHLATNYTLVSGEYLKLFYRPLGSDDQYLELAYTAGMTYGEAIAANGVFEILEANTNGVRHYCVYIDRQAPFVELSYVDVIGSTQKLVLNQENSGTYVNAKSISIGQMQGEVDSLSYILLYKASNLKLLDVITYEELKSKAYALDNDHYIAHIYDRSGNYCVVNIRANDSSLDCNIKEQENEYITIETNRDANQIQYYEVYLNGDLVTNVYSPLLKLTKSGLYQVNIKDWYGNFQSIEYNFELTLPTVDWKYEIDGQVYNYTEDSSAMRIQKLGDSDYFVLSSGLLQFTLKSGYAFEFIGETPLYTHSYINNRVKFQESAMFTVKIYYITNPHVYVTYNVSFDETPPDISASYIEKEYIYEELKHFFDNITNYQDNEILIPDSLDISLNAWTYNKITDGQVFDSDLITLKFNDSTGINNIKVYLDGELLKEIVYGEEMSEISFSRRGKYKIVATDVLGNVRELSFVNRSVSKHQLEIDSNDETVASSKLYGNESLKIDFLGNGEVSYLINCDGKTYYISLRVEGGVIYRSYYFVGRDDNLNSTLCVDDTMVFEINDDTKPNIYYDLISEGLIFKVMYDDENNFTIHASLTDDKVYEFECRVLSQDDQPFIYRGRLSNKKTDIEITDYKNNPLVTNQEGNYIYLSKEFNVVETPILEEVDCIKVYHSIGGEILSSNYIYKDGVLLNSKFTEDGLYEIEIRNIYGTITTYYLAMSNTFITTSKVVDKQGNEFIYSKDYNDKLYSNNNISISAFSNTITYQVLKDGKVYNPQVVEENGQTTIVLSSQGDYVISFKDEYGNEKVFTAEIKTLSLIYDDKLVFGYSEKAQKDYTNKKLSINHSLFEKYGISYVSIIFQAEEFIIYDLINENEVEFDLKSFEECIGIDGQAGSYTIIFKDKFGNEMQKVINYNDNTTLELSRTTRSDAETSYDVETAIQEGFWSNMVLKFDTDAKNYVFKVNGESLQLPYVLNFGTEALAAEIHYSIYYLDEYGFEHEFEACLCRKDIEIKVLNTDVEVIGDLPTTKSNIKFSVDANTTVTYTIDGGNEVIYSGEELYKDGVYRIEATDKAGNKSAITIKKDTFVYYRFHNVGKNEVIINGEVVNSNQVSFKVTNDDTSYIEKVFLNGILLEDYDSNTFSQNGKWEFIISDKMGNKSYFSFHQVLKTMQSFDYETPEYYKISEIQYVSVSGIEMSYMDFVQQNEINSQVLLSENGTYKIKITSILDNSSKTFEIRIDSSAPEITLIGCEIGGSTKEDVIIEGYEVGDTIYIYKDGKLVSKTYVSSKSITPPTIKDGGEYEVVVESEAGVRTVVEFEKDHIANTAGSILIIILILATVICLFVGLLFRNKLKVDN